MTSPAPVKPERLAPLPRDAVRAGPYSYRAPSPPFIRVPFVPRARGTPMDLLLAPSTEQADGGSGCGTTGGAASDLAAITRGAAVAQAPPHGRAASWTYEQRRQAQPVLDFLYLGPTSVVRDHAWLADQGITMVLVARDARMAGGRLPSLDAARAALGVEACVLDVDGAPGLVRAFDEAVERINHHLLAVHRGRESNADAEADAAGTPVARRGKVLVACESGNDRSAGIVAAYIMAVFDRPMIPTVQFTSLQRFCCSFDEEVKRTLQTWEDILTARRAVAQDMRAAGQAQVQTQDGTPGPGTPATQARLRAKRSVDDMMDLDDYDDDVVGGKPRQPENDVERFSHRASCAPFRDTSGP